MSRWKVGERPEEGGLGLGGLDLASLDRLEQGGGEPRDVRGPHRPLHSPFLPHASSLSPARLEDHSAPG